MHEKSWSEEIRLVDDTGVEYLAAVDLVERDGSEGGYRRTECGITVRWDGGEMSEVGRDFFSAFRLLRVRLAASGLLPLCYGASRKVILTGMALDMSLGLRVYLAEIGRPVDRRDVVSIFDSGSDVEAVSVEEQDAFKA